ncbi:MAG: hypothetical protein R2695_16130 [Acidimicrobiales bacterium]
MQMPAQNPEIEALYYAECEGTARRASASPPIRSRWCTSSRIPRRRGPSFGQHFWLEASTYDSWQPEGQTSAVHTHATDVDELRAEGIYQFLTPIRRSTGSGDGCAVAASVGGRHADRLGVAVDGADGRQGASRAARPGRCVAAVTDRGDRPPRTLADLAPVERRRAIRSTALRCVAYPFVLIAVYAVVPFARHFDGPVLVRTLGVWWRSCSS